jgi:hypothetical protein
MRKIFFKKFSFFKNLLLFIFLFFTFQFHFTQLVLAQGGNWLSGWKYRQKITITNTTNEELTYYQVLITLDTSYLIQQGKMGSNCEDIRFTGEDGKIIDHYLESGCNSSQTKIWVKVPSIPASGSTIIYLYYGGASGGGTTKDRMFQRIPSSQTKGCTYFTSSGQAGGSCDVVFNINDFILGKFAFYEFEANLRIWGDFRDSRGGTESVGVDGICQVNESTPAIIVTLNGACLGYYRTNSNTCNTSLNAPTWPKIFKWDKLGSTPNSIKFTSDSTQMVNRTSYTIPPGAGVRCSPYRGCNGEGCSGYSCYVCENDERVSCLWDWNICRSLNLGRCVNRICCEYDCYDRNPFTGRWEPYYFKVEYQISNVYVRKFVNPEPSVRLDPSETLPSVSLYYTQTQGIEGTVTSTSFDVKLNQAGPLPVTVYFNISGSASRGNSCDDSGTDYVLPVNSVTIPAGQTATTVNVEICDDKVKETLETFTITISSSTNASIEENNKKFTFTIVDNDQSGIFVEPSSGLITDETGKTATFTVSLLSKPTSNVNISITSSNTNEATVSPSSLTFTTNNWNSPQTVTVSGVDDGDVADGDKSYVITLIASSSDANYNGLRIDITGTNLDNDTPGIVVDRNQLTTKESGDPEFFQVKLKSRPNKSVVIVLEIDNPREGVFKDESGATSSRKELTFSTDEWNSYKKVTVYPVDDDVFEGGIGVTYNINLKTVSMDSNYNLLSAKVTVTNYDDDQPPGVTTGTLENPLSATSAEGFLGRVVNFFLMLGVSLSTLSVLLGGFVILTSGGSYERVEMGKRFIFYGVLAIFVILGARLFVSFIDQIFNK